MDVESVLKTASLYISMNLSTSAIVCSRQEEGMINVSNHFGGQREEHLLHNLMRNAPDKSLIYLEGDFSICSCLVFIDRYLLFIGPYKTKALQKKELLSYRSMDAEKTEQFLKFHSIFPLVSQDEVEIAARIPFLVLFGNAVDIHEQYIQTFEYEKDVVPPVRFEPEYMNMDLAAERTRNSLSLLSALREGNNVAAIKIYESILQTKRKIFVKEATLEGLTSLRTLLSLAMNTMQVPTNAAYPLLREYKLKARTVSSREEAHKLSVNAIIQTCALIRRQIGAKYSPTVREALDYIHSNLSRPLTIEDIADEVHMTEGAFTRKFHQETELTPTEYIARERMRQAADLLVYTNLSIENICTQIGMMDANYFARCFKKRYGMSPTLYRNKSQKD